MGKAPKVVIAGAGVIGLTIGWELVQAGCEVVLFDKGTAGRQASWQAGGMLAPAAEIQFEEPDLYRFSRESTELWPEFVKRLEAASGMDVGLRTEGTLVVSDDADSRERLRRVYDFQVEEGLNVRWLTGAEARDQEPFLAPRVTAGVLSPDDIQVDNRRLVLALIEAIRKHGGEVREDAPVAAIEPDERRPRMVLESGEEVAGDVVVLAAGAWSRRIEGLAKEDRPPVRPVKGQMIELKMIRPFELGHVVRGPHGYLVPKPGGRLLLGATSEEMGFDTDVTGGGLYKLLEGAWEIVPGIYDLPVVDTWAGLRPASRDHQPIIGFSSAPGVFMATGHYRHGVMLAPLTARVSADLILGKETSPWPGPFSPLRFKSN